MPLPPCWRADGWSPGAERTWGATAAKSRRLGEWGGERGWAWNGLSKAFKSRQTPGVMEGEAYGISCQLSATCSFFLGGGWGLGCKYSGMAQF